MTLAQYLFGLGIVHDIQTNFVYLGVTIIPFGIISAINAIESIHSVSFYSTPFITGAFITFNEQGEADRVTYIEDLED